MVGCIRIISQFISFELIFTTIILIFIWSFNDLSYLLFFLSFLLCWIISFYFPYFLLFSLFTSILAESNRVPFDLPEAESELVAGFITEYSSISFSLIILTEYANIISISFLIIILFSIMTLYLLYFLFLVCLIRSSLNRCRFDELMTNAWIVILPIIFSVLMNSVILFEKHSMKYDNLFNSFTYSFVFILGTSMKGLSLPLTHVRNVIFMPTATAITYFTFTILSWSINGLATLL